MKKIGVLTFHYSINEGAMLQGIALKEVCQRLFSDAKVELINYEIPVTRKRDFKHCFERPRSISSIYSQLERYRRLNAFKNNSLGLNGERLDSSDYIQSADFINKQNYDIIIVGSDEVWKVVSGKKDRPFPNVYWLGKEIHTNKVSYAASANKTKLDKLSDEDKSRIKESLQQYQFIGVRDEITYNLVDSVITDNHKLQKVADPTLIVDDGDLPKPDITDKLRKAGYDPSKPAVLINANPKISNISADYFHKKGWQVVGVTKYCQGADVNLVGKLNPFEWISALSHCQFSVTNRFHGTIFSIRERVPFVSVEVSDNYFKTNASKLKNLLKDFDMEDHLYLCSPKEFNKKDFINKIDEKMESSDLSQIGEKISALKENSLQFLRQLSSL